MIAVTSTRLSRPSPLAVNYIVCEFVLLRRNNKVKRIILRVDSDDRREAGHG